MRKIIIAFSLFILIFGMLSCKHIDQETQLEKQLVNILKAQVGDTSIIKKHKLTIYKPVDLNIETDVSISKIEMKIKLPDGKFIDKEFQPNTNVFNVKLTKLEDGRNVLYITIYAENRKEKSLVTIINFNKPTLNPIVYVDVPYNIVKNENDIIKTNSENAKVIVESNVAFTVAHINDGVENEMSFDSSRKKATYEVKDISSTQKNITVTLSSDGYKTFKLSFMLVRGTPDIKVIKAKFEGVEFDFDKNNVATIKDADIKYASGLLELEFNTKDGLVVEIVGSTSGYVSQVVKGSGLKGDIGVKEDLNFIFENKYTLNIIIINKETQLKLKIKGNGYNESEYVLNVEAVEKTTLSQGNQLATRNAYTNKGSGVSGNGLIWPYVYSDGNNTYYRTMGDLIACNFEHDNMEKTFYVYTRLKNKDEKEKEDGEWIKWGPSKYVEDWKSSILNVRVSSEEKEEFYLDGIYANEDLKPILMSKALFRRATKYGMLFDAATIANNKLTINQDFATKGRDYQKSVAGFDKVSEKGFYMKASELGLNAETDFFRGYWTSTKEIEEAKTKISVQDTPSGTPMVVSGWEDVKIKLVKALDLVSIRPCQKDSDSSYFHFEKNKIYTVELSIKVKDEVEIVKAKYVIDYKN